MLPCKLVLILPSFCSLSHKNPTLCCNLCHSNQHWISNTQKSFSSRNSVYRDDVEMNVLDSLNRTAKLAAVCALLDEFNRSHSWKFLILCSRKNFGVRYELSEFKKCLLPNFGVDIAFVGDGLESLQEWNCLWWWIKSKLLNLDGYTTASLEDPWIIQRSFLWSMG